MTVKPVKSPGAKPVLSPWASVFIHDGRGYLFDPVTRTCAALSEGMMAFLRPGEGGSTPINDLVAAGPGLAAAIGHLQRLGILIPAGADPPNWERAMPSAGPNDHLVVFATTKCNLRCVYCYANGGDTSRTIDEDVWRIAMGSFFDTLAADESARPDGRREALLTLHGGGEPTTEFSLLKRIVDEFSARAGILGREPVIWLVTNGTYGRSVGEWILERNVQVSISLDGPRNVQDRQRPRPNGASSFDAVIRNLQSLVSAGRQIWIRATITDESVDSMEDTVRLAEGLGLVGIMFEPVASTGRGTNAGVMKPSVARFVDRFLSSYLLGLDLKVDVRCSGMRWFNRPSRRFCSACTAVTCVTPDGDVTACYEVLGRDDPAADTFMIGSIDRIGRRVVLDTDRIAALRERVADNMDTCRTCFMRYHCAGDCLVRSYRLAGDLYSPDQYRCQITRRINAQLIAWFADGVIEADDPRTAEVVAV